MRASYVACAGILVWVQISRFYSRSRSKVLLRVGIITGTPSLRLRFQCFVLSPNRPPPRLRPLRVLFFYLLNIV
jgi:hypothetical protein